MSLLNALWPWNKCDKCNKKEKYVSYESFISAIEDIAKTFNLIEKDIEEIKKRIEK